MTTAPAPLSAAPDQRLLVAFVALLAGAIAMGVSPAFVRHADVGPFASAFWRATLALPLLAVWARLERPRGAPAHAGPRRRSPPACCSPATCSSGIWRS